MEYCLLDCWIGQINKFLFVCWIGPNDPEICCFKRNSGKIPDQMETVMFMVYVT